MPGTVYTRTGPGGDPVGRLADFARFAALELLELWPADMSELAGYQRQTRELAGGALELLEQLAELLEGYTTADVAAPPIPCYPRTDDT